jgi:hypothetical protein
VKLVIASIAVAFAAIAGITAPVASAAPMEDEPGFSCVDDGNKICGPGNEQGVPAGRYDVDGVLVDPWPVS